MDFKSKCFIVVLMVFLQACGGGSEEATSELPPPVESVALATLELKSVTQLMLAGENSGAELFVEAKDVNGNTLIENQYDVIFHAGDETFTDSTFVTALDKEHVIYASSGSIESNTLSIVAREEKDYEVVEIPIIFHIASYNGQVLSGESEFNFDTMQLQAAIDKLNRYFSNDFNSKNTNAVDTGIRFRLARYAPDGTLLEEHGINRIEVAAYDDGRLADTQYPSPSDIPNDERFGSLEIRHIANDHHWDPHHYKNVIIINSQDASWADYYPMPAEGMLEGQQTYSEYFSGDTNDIYTDTLVLTPSSVDTWVFAHEMGHAFNLGHVFSYNEDCDNADYSADTYSYKRPEPNSICEDKSLGMNKLHPDDNAYYQDNLMDYNGKLNTFTYDQRERMRFVLENAVWLQELIHSPN